MNNPHYFGISYYGKFFYTEEVHYYIEDRSTMYLGKTYALKFEKFHTDVVNKNGIDAMHLWIKMNDDYN